MKPVITRYYQASLVNENRFETGNFMEKYTH